MQRVNNRIEIFKAIAEIRIPNSVSDAEVEALCAQTAIVGVF